MKLLFSFSLFLSPFFLSFSQTYTGNLWLNSPADVTNFANMGYTQVNGELKIHGSLTAITDLSPLSNLTTVTGNLIIFGNHLLEDLSGLNNLTTVGQSLKITNNSILESIEGLNQLTAVGNYLVIEDNYILTSLEGLNQLTTVDNYIMIQDNFNLTSLSGLNNLSVTENLSISNNHSLPSLNGLEQLTSVKSIYIQNNTALTSLSGLDGLTTVDEGIGISRNPVLNALNGFNNLTHIGSLSISYNDSLVDLTGLDNLTHITSTLNIGHFTFGNDTIDYLHSLNGLDNLTYVGQYLAIRNTKCTTLDGLNNLIQTGSVLFIDNPDLSDYCALDNLILNNGIQGSYTSENNLYNPDSIDLVNGACVDCAFSNSIDPSISILGQQIGANQTGASYQWLSCDNNYAIIPNETSNIFTTNTYGNFAVEITYNGCVDTSACTTINALDIESLNPLDGITIAPNPTTGTLNIDFNNLENLNLNIYNQLGQIIHAETAINQSEYVLEFNVPAGIYTITVFNNVTQKQFKVIKNN